MVPPGRSILDQELRYLPGVGPRRAERLSRLGLATPAELLLVPPRRHEDRRARTAIAALRAGARATVAGRVDYADARRISGGRHLLEVGVADETGELSAVWFNQPYLADKFRRGAQIILTGKADVYRGLARMSAPEFEIVEPDEGESGIPYARLAFDRLVPVYGLTEGLSQRFMRRLVWTALEQCAPAWPEVFAENFRRARRLLPIAAALRGLHFPDGPAHAAAAYRRLAYEELLVLQLLLARNRRRLLELGAARRYPVTPEIDRHIRARLPFKLTGAQDRAVAEISRDLAAAAPMNRLLQGDVGSGKTAVATYACLAAVAGRGQAAVMAPTEVLAEQHFRTFTRLLAGSRVRLAYLAGRLPPAGRRKLVEQVAAGDVDIVIGTHAVIQKEVRFRELGLAVLDEQHKFGVEQRLSLALKGANPHVLVMSATPIPRTLARAYYADLDLSTLDELPGGARRVTTRVVTKKSRPKVWDFVAKCLARGERAYVIYPAIEETRDSELPPAAPRPPPTAYRLPPTGLAAAETGFRELAARFGALRVGLLHGRMKPDEKRAVMDRFRAGKIGVLVATTVVEVGLDVPEATVMVVEGAERFGLAALHQLRGRIGRDAARKRAWFIGIAGTLERTALHRLKALVTTTDGFKIAEQDLLLRGPGEFLGRRQHGLPELRFTDLGRDGELLTLARRDAAAIMARDPELATAEHRALGERLKRVIPAGLPAGGA